MQTRLLHALSPQDLGASGQELAEPCNAQLATGRTLQLQIKRFLVGISGEVIPVSRALCPLKNGFFITSCFNKGCFPMGAVAQTGVKFWGTKVRNVILEVRCWDQEG